MAEPVRVVCRENMKVGRKRLNQLLAENDMVRVQRLDDGFDCFVSSQAVNDLNSVVQAYLEKKKANPLLCRMDEYELYARIWDDKLLANVLEEKMEGSLWNKRLFLVGEFSDAEEKNVVKLCRKFRASRVDTVEQANVFILGRKAFAHDPDVFRAMLRRKSKDPYVKIIGKPTLQKKGQEDCPPVKKRKGKRKEKLYFGKMNPHIYPTSYVALDLEATSDRSSNKIIEVGMVKVRNGKEVASFQSLVNPHEKLRPVIVDLTGITDSMLEDAPDIQKLQKDILNFLGDDPVVGHSVQNDMKLLAENLNLPLDNNYIDTCKIALTMLPEREKFSLASLAEEYGLTRSTHRALDDAITSWQVLEKFRELFAEKAPNGD